MENDSKKFDTGIITKKVVQKQSEIVLSNLVAIGIFIASIGLIYVITRAILYMPNKQLYPHWFGYGFFLFFVIPFLFGIIFFGILPEPTIKRIIVNGDKMIIEKRFVHKKDVKYEFQLSKEILLFSNINTDFPAFTIIFKNDQNDYRILVIFRKLIPNFTEVINEIKNDITLDNDKKVVYIDAKKMIDNM